MNKKILICIDDSIHSNNAIRYVVKISSFVKELSYTLFNGQPAISQFLLDEANSSLKAQSALDKVKKKNTENSRNLLEKCKNRMMEMGVSADRIDLKTTPRRIGLAADILEIAHESRYDAVVVGRRGLTKLQEVFMGSLTTKLLEHSRIIPVWVIDGEIESTKIMLAIDGSESSLRAVDHFCFMVGQNPNLKVTLLHILSGGNYCPIDFNEEDKEIQDIITRTDRKCVDHFFVHAQKKFKEAGIQDHQIEIQQIKHTGNVGKTIIEEVKAGNFGTVVVGRRGVNKAFFIGSVSQYLVERIDNRSLWLVP